MTASGSTGGVAAAPALRSALRATRRIALRRPWRAALLAALIIAMILPAAASAAAPVGVVDGPSTATTGVPVGFDAAQSSDPDGDVLTFAWSIDGQGLTIDQPWLAVAFAHPGVHVTSVTVTDATGAAVTVEHPVLVTGEDRSTAGLSPLHSVLAGPRATLPQVRLQPPKVRVRRHALRLHVGCRGAGVCQGTLRAVALVGRLPRQHALLLAHRTFSVLRGRRTVHLRLTPAGRRRLTAHRRVRVTAYLGSVRVAHIWAVRDFRVGRRHHRHA